MDIKDKILTREILCKMCVQFRKEGKTIGFTSGSFDLLHLGHVSYLEKACKKCDILIVGVNSDESVKSYKDPKRPIVPQEDRIKMLAHLQSVSYTFLFNERRNKINIEEIKPHLYIKAGDYKPEELTSAKYLKPWNGKPLLIPPVENRSTSNLINNILDKYSNNLIKGSEIAINHPKSKVVLIDRDGVINPEIEYLHKPEQFSFIDGVIEGLQILQEQGYKIVIITNQSGIGLGYFSREEFFIVNKKMLTICSQNKILIDKIYFCPHSKSDNCNCRKPKTGMIEKAQKELNFVSDQSILIGDKTSDILAGQKSNLTTILVKTGQGGNDGEFDISPTHVTKDLKEAALLIKDKY